MYLKYILFAVQSLKWPFCVALKTNLLTLTVRVLWLPTEQHWKFCQIKFVKWRWCVLKHCEIRALRQMFRSTTCTLHVLSSQNISGFIYLLKWDPIRSILIDKEKCAIPVRRAIYKKEKQNVCGKRGCGVWLFWPGNDLWKLPSLSQISKVCVPEMLLNNTKVESGLCNCVCVCACCSVGSLQSYCCFSYHPGLKQIACQNKCSHFLAMGRQLSERMHLGCIFILSTRECLQIKIFVLVDLKEVKRHVREQWADLSFKLCCVLHSLPVTQEETAWSECGDWKLAGQHSLRRTVQSFYHFFLFSMSAI